MVQRRPGGASWTPTDQRQERAGMEPAVAAVIEAISRSRWRWLGCAIVYYRR
jgi:hypothetical protein